MEKKKKFKPVITRVKLNPEQAVLVCSCYDISMAAYEDYSDQEACIGGSKTKTSACAFGWAAAS